MKTHTDSTEILCAGFDAGRFLRTLICMAVGFMILATGCEKKKTYRIGVSQCSDDAWREKLNDEIKREMILYDDAEVEIRSADDNSARQISDLNYFLDNGFDIIIAAPNEADSLSPVVKKIYESGTPVMIFDRDIHGDTYTAFQGAGNKEIGRMAAQAASTITQGDARVIEITGLRGSMPAEDRSAGFSEQAGRMPGVRILGRGYGDWREVHAEFLADSLLRKYPEANVIYAHNDCMAIAASKVASRLGRRKSVKIIGVDAAPEIGLKAVADSVIDLTFTYPTEGSRLIRTAMDIIKGRPYEKRVILPITYMVDPATAEILLAQNRALVEETSKIEKLKYQVDDYWTQYTTQQTLLYAVLFILALLFILIFVLLRAYWVRKRDQNELALRNHMLEEQRDREKALNEQLLEATQSKLRFFTNVSHDLRTPLTLISGPVEELAKSNNLDDSQRAMLRIARKNVHILMRLLNEILDFRKYENGKLHLTPSECNLEMILSEWCDSFKPLAARRGISFELNIEPGVDYSAYLDVGKIERVIFNLISNAIKYSKAGSSVKIGLRKNDNVFIIDVSDTGKGISSEDLSHIFERFFQADKVHPSGSGIGLTLAKAFIELHGGCIRAESEPGVGSEFTVTLPVRVDVKNVEGTGTCNTDAADAKEKKGDVLAELETCAGSIVSGDETEKEVILVIDDNSDMRAMLSTFLSGSYDVVSAQDGESGIRAAVKYVPDLIICDVMMPGMDGMECCRRLKEEEATSHIPVLMLTACTMDEQRVQGYESGADGYVSKPFNPRVLLARIKALISNRRRIKSLIPFVETAVGNAHTTSRESDREVVGEIDSEFYRRFSDLVEKRMSDADLSVDSLASEMGLGRTQFFRKIKALTNYSPVVLLRNMRLAKARQLIMATDMGIAEIGYHVGFSSPSYFGKCYKDRYGNKPGDDRG